MSVPQQLLSVPEIYIFLYSDTQKPKYSEGTLAIQMYKETIN